MKKTKLNYELFFIFILPLIFMCFNITFNVNSVNEFNLVSLVYSSTFVNTESPIFSLFSILFNVLNVDELSVIFKIIVDYTCLWFILFIVWHVFYGLFDLMIHLFTKSNYESKGE